MLTSIAMICGRGLLLNPIFCEAYKNPTSFVLWYAFVSVSVYCFLWCQFVVLWQWLVALHWLWKAQSYVKLLYLYPFFKAVDEIWEIVGSKVGFELLFIRAHCQLNHPWAIKVTLTKPVGNVCTIYLPILVESRGQSLTKWVFDAQNGSCRFKISPIKRNAMQMQKKQRGSDTRVWRMTRRQNTYLLISWKHAMSSVK